jgi:hypothetical protein
VEVVAPRSVGRDKHVVEVVVSPGAITYRLVEEWACSPDPWTRGYGILP